MYVLVRLPRGQAGAAGLPPAHRGGSTRRQVGHSCFTTCQRSRHQRWKTWEQGVTQRCALLLQSMWPMQITHSRRPLPASQPLPRTAMGTGRL